MLSFAWLCYQNVINWLRPTFLQELLINVAFGMISKVIRFVIIDYYKRSASWLYVLKGQNK
jgi:hypothetical protein